MAIKDVLVILEPGEDGRHIDDYAISFSQKMGAHLTAAGVGLMAIAPVSFVGDYPYDLLVKAAEESRAAAEEAYQRLRRAAPESLETEFVLVEGLSGEAHGKVGQLARHFDLTIVCQGGPESDSFEAQNAIGTVFASGRPVMVVPYIHKGPAKLGRAMVAWDQGMVAARALAYSLPLLRQCSEVEVVTVSAPGLPVEELPGFNITRHLARHGIKAELKNIPTSGDIASTILSHAADTSPDFMVMGCYGHSRLREMVLGGTSRTILQSMTVPVLMAH